MTKHILSFLLIFSFISNAEPLPSDKAQGFFIAFGVGPRLPLSSFSNSTDLGYGLNVEFSYTDTDVLPFFVFTKVGFETYPGSRSFYQATDYSNFSTNILPVHFGVRHYFSPILQNIVLLIPMVELSAAYTYYQKLHEFKPGSGRSNFTEDSSKFGFSVGGGFSMFLMEIAANYNYFQSNQFISVDLKVRLPLFISF